MKNIVLLSDGTGNSAAKKNKTNVWRLYAALDLHDDNQIAMYDDGVGSSDSTWSKILGGAFGYGLKRNVIELYKYLCRNYRCEPDKPELADKIYLFGFSRGAFTVRVLAGFVLQAGLYTQYKDEADLDKKARQNFRYFQYQSFGGRWVGVLSRLAGRLLGLGRKACGDTRVSIEFIGVWDTVSAYGFPIKELAMLWNRVIYPLNFSDQRLHPDVKRACHALAVDDERHSFHPMLWDEQGEPPERLEQVWFPGAHADVGGGYTRSSLSLVPLDWMLTKVEADDSSKGLLFIQDIRQQYHSQSDWNGPQHDSRAGLGMYYRYKPRPIDRLCNDKSTGVTVSLPKIHQSVFERIQGRSVPYAPSGIPADYQVVCTDGKRRSYETPQQARRRCAAMNRVADVIYWRRELYFSILIITLLLLTSRFYLDWDAEGACRGSACFVDPLMRLAMSSLPDFTAGWFEALRQNPKWLWGLSAVFGVLLVLRHRARKVSRRHAVCAWAVLKGKDESLIPEWKPGITTLLRTSSDAMAPVFSWTAGIILFVVILYLIAAAANAIAFHWRYTTGGLCQYSANAQPVRDSRYLKFDSRNPCFASGLHLQKGVRYRITVDDDTLYDGDSISTDANGYTRNLLIPAVPLRRHMAEPWFRLFGRIGKRGFETFALGSGDFEYTPRADGELFFYVNDAVLGLWPEWDLAYGWESGKNQGRVNISVTPVETPIRMPR